MMRHAKFSISSLGIILLVQKCLLMPVKVLALAFFLDSAKEMGRNYVFLPAVSNKD